MKHEDRFTLADALFSEALDLPETERTAFLDRACAGDRELRELVRRLLARADTSTLDVDLRTGGGLSPFAHDPRLLVPDLTGRSFLQQAG